MKTPTNSNGEVYVSADVILETDDGFEWICECGSWNTHKARQYAKLIAKLLNDNIKTT